MMAQMSPQLAARVARVAADRWSGAAALAAVATRILIDAHRESRGVVAAVAAALCQAQPSMAPVWNAAALALRPDGRAALGRYGKRLERAPAAVARVASSTLLAGHPADETLSVATVSASGSVRRALTHLAKRCPLRVLCGEGRPLFEGRGLATALAAAGIAATVCTDAAVSTLSGSASVVLVGADAVAADWFLNKCGTRQVVEVAARRGGAVYVVASLDKFIHPRLAPLLRTSGGDLEEVWDDAPDRVEVANPYFEKIPTDSLSGVITESGLIGSGSIPAAVSALLSDADAARAAALVS